MANYTGGYRLGQSTMSSLRLNLQHYLWKRACGFNLHPRIPLNSTQPLKVADVATGTGIWMDDLKQELGDRVTIDGFDKSMKQCPPAELCPAGCTASQLDILLDIPEHLRNVYDIVNVRLIQGGLGDDPAPALKNLIAMLKPGGYLQWQEINMSTLKISTVNPSLDQTATKELLKEIPTFGFGKWTPRLAEICTEGGLLDVRTDCYRVPPEITIPFVQTQLGAYEEVSWSVFDNSTPQSKGPHFRQLLDQANKELRSGVWLDHALEVTTAIKPS